MLRFTNCGVSGDSAEGAVLRFDDDILPTRPTTAVVMFGMNDVWRSNYDPDVPFDDANRARRAEAIDRFDSATRKLIELLRGNGCERITLMTPCPFDDEVESAQKNLPGVNAALGIISERASAIADDFGTAFIDIHTPMTEIGRRMRETDPTRTLNRLDRVHPMEVGMRVKAELFLQAQGVKGNDAHVVIDAAKGVVVWCDNAAVKDVEPTASGVVFTMTTAALPLPIDDTARKALALLGPAPVQSADLLAVTSLPKRHYFVLEDGATSYILDGGMSVRFWPTGSGPRNEQSQELFDLIEAQRALQCRFRDMRFVEYKLFLRPDLDLDDPVATESEMAGILGAAKSRGEDTTYLEHVWAGFKEIRPVMRETLERIDALSVAITDASKPREHRYDVLKAKTTPYRGRR